MPGLSLQGKVLISSRTSDGNPKGARWIGNASAASIKLNQNRVERNESFSGSRLPYRAMTTGRGGTFECTFDEYSKENMSLIALGTANNRSSGTLTAWEVPGGANGFSGGETIITPYPGLTVTSIVDSAGTPATLPTNKYTVDGPGGTIALASNLGSFTQPFKVTGSYEARNVVGAFLKPTEEYWLHFDGVNTDDNNARVIVDIYRVRLDPAEVFDLIHNDNLAEFKISGSVLADTTKAIDAVGGQFYRVYFP